MRPLIVACPSCGGRLGVSRLNCAECLIDIEGEFELPTLMRLSPSHLDFVEVFLKNRGVIREVERELGVSYPTVRARLDEVIKALGYQSRIAEDDRSLDDANENRRRAVLEELRAGSITAEQALTALHSVSSASDQKKEDAKK